MKEKTQKIIEFIKKYYALNPFAKKAVIGISGGKDSSVVAALCVEALGKENVYGVIMPNGEMADLADAMQLVNFLRIPHKVINISTIYNAFKSSINKGLDGGKELSRQGEINIAPRIRMTTLYAVASAVDGLVANTSNKSEAVLGYCTKWGDNVGDFAPLIHLTMQEVLEVGADLGLPENLVQKAPADGLTGSTDEQNFGFTYADLKIYIDAKVSGQNAEINLPFNVVEKIEKRIKANAHKSLPIPRVE